MGDKTDIDAEFVSEADASIIRAIEAKVPEICSALGLPEGCLKIRLGKNGEAYAGFDEVSDISHYTPIFGDTREQQVTVLAALIGAGHAKRVFKEQRLARLDGYYHFASLADLAACVEAFTGEKIAQAHDPRSEQKKFVDRLRERANETHPLEPLARQQLAMFASSEDQFRRR